MKIIKILAAGAVFLCGIAALCACSPEQEQGETPDRPDTGEEIVSPDGESGGTQQTPITLTLDARGGTLEETSIRAEEDGTAQLPAPVRNGYLFTGWHLGAQDGAEEVDNNTVFSASITLYAHYTLLFSYEGEADFPALDLSVGDPVYYPEESILYHAPLSEAVRADFTVTVDGAPLGSNSNNRITGGTLAAQGENTRISFSIDWMLGRAGSYQITLFLTRTDNAVHTFTQSFTVRPADAQEGDVLAYYYAQVDIYGGVPTLEEMEKSTASPAISAARGAYYLLYAVCCVGNAQGEVTSFCTSSAGTVVSHSFQREEEIVAVLAMVRVNTGGNNIFTVGADVGELKASARFTLGIFDRTVSELVPENLQINFLAGDTFTLGAEARMVARFDDGTQDVLSAEE